MCKYAYTNKYTYIFMQKRELDIYQQKSNQFSRCKSLFKCMYAYTYTHTRPNAYMRICVAECAESCMNVCMRICIYKYIYIHSSTHIYIPIENSKFDELLNMRKFEGEQVGFLVPPNRFKCVHNDPAKPPMNIRRPAHHHLPAVCIHTYLHTSCAYVYTYVYTCMNMYTVLITHIQTCYARITIP
jgi:hypothetical protein